MQYLSPNAVIIVCFCLLPNTFVVKINCAGNRKAIMCHVYKSRKDPRCSNFHVGDFPMKAAVRAAMIIGQIRCRVPHAKRRISREESMLYTFISKV